MAAFGAESCKTQASMCLGLVSLLSRVVLTIESADCTVQAAISLSSVISRLHAFPFGLLFI